VLPFAADVEGRPPRRRLTGRARARVLNGVDAVEIDGLRVAYERAGSGPALVLLHGILDDARAWRPQVDGLCDAFTVVAWEAPGCGHSDDPPEGFTAADYADCLAALVETLGLERPALCGLSWGSGLALELYRRRPDLPSALVLASGYAGWKGSLPPDEVARRLAQCLAESEMAPEDFVPGWIPGLLTDAAPPGLVDEVVAVMSDFHPAGYRAMALAFAELDLRPVLPTITVPTLLLWGEHDRRSPVPVAEAMHSQIPGSQLVVLPGVGHLGNLEASDAFNQAVRSFLAG
jgi:pimeloyl-ACP methyl ester carboxylesterase